MVNQVTRALTPEQVAAIERKDSPSPMLGAAAAALSEQKASTVKVKFIEKQGRPSTISVPLDFPVEVDGATIEEVIIRRPSMREWRKYLRDCLDAVKMNGPGADDLVDQVWISVPAAVLEELDFVDGTRIEAAQDGFFGRSALPQETEEGASSTASEIGEASPST